MPHHAPIPNPKSWNIEEKEKTSTINVVILLPLWIKAILFS
jgi:hypothetical protein